MTALRACRDGLREAGHAEGLTVRNGASVRAADQLDRHPKRLRPSSSRRSLRLDRGAMRAAAPAIAATGQPPRLFAAVHDAPRTPLRLSWWPSSVPPGGNLARINLFIGELMSTRLERPRARCGPGRRETRRS